MIGRSVALDAQQIAARPGWISYCEVNEKACDADLRMNLIPAFLKSVRKLDFKYAVMIALRGTRHGEATRPGIMEEELERKHTFTLPALKINILVSDRSKDFATALCPADKNIEPSLASLATEWAKRHRHIAVDILPIAHRDEDHVTLVPLHALQVLDDERHHWMGAEI